MSELNISKTYYKGKLFSAKQGESLKPQFITKKQPLAIYDNKTKKMTFLKPELFSEEERENLRLYLRTIMREDCGVSRSDIIEIFNRLFPKEEIFAEFQKETTDLDQEIIFTPVMDNDENFYGCELHSNLYFPFVTPNNVDTNYRIKITSSPTGLEEEYEIVANSRILVSMMDDFSTIISSPVIVTQEELQSYNNLFKGFFGSKRRSVFNAELAKKSEGNIPRQGVYYIDIPSFEVVMNRSLEETRKI